LWQPADAGELTFVGLPIGIGSMVTLGGFFILLLDVARLNFRVNPYLHGSARWADFSDIKAAGLLNNDGV
jgi:type IV secretion system protein VirD4